MFPKSNKEKKKTRKNNRKGRRIIYIWLVLLCMGLRFYDQYFHLWAQLAHLLACSFEARDAAISWRPESLKHRQAAKHEVSIKRTNTICMSNVNNNNNNDISTWVLQLEIAILSFQHEQSSAFNTNSGHERVLIQAQISGSLS